MRFLSVIATSNWACERKAVVNKLNKLCMNFLGQHCRSGRSKEIHLPHLQREASKSTSFHFSPTIEQQSALIGEATVSGPSVILSRAMVGKDDTAGTGNTLKLRALLGSKLPSTMQVLRQNSTLPGQLSVSKYLEWAEANKQKWSRSLRYICRNELARSC